MAFEAGSVSEWVQWDIGFWKVMRVSTVVGCGVVMAGEIHRSVCIG